MRGWEGEREGGILSEMRGSFVNRNRKEEEGVPIKMLLLCSALLCCLDGDGDGVSSGTLCHVASPPDSRH